MKKVICLLSRGHTIRGSETLDRGRPYLVKTLQVQVIRNRGVMYRGIQHDVFGFIHVFPSVAAIQEKTYLDTLLRAITAGWIRYQPCYIHGFVKGV